MTATRKGVLAKDGCQSSQASTTLTSHEEATREESFFSGHFTTSLRSSKDKPSPTTKTTSASELPAPVTVPKAVAMAAPRSWVAHDGMLWLDKNKNNLQSVTYGQSYKNPFPTTHEVNLPNPRQMNPNLGWWSESPFLRGRQAVFHLFSTSVWNLRLKHHDNGKERLIAPCTPR